MKKIIKPVKAWGLFDDHNILMRTTRRTPKQKLYYRVVKNPKRDQWYKYSWIKVLITPIPNRRKK